MNIVVEGLLTTYERVGKGRTVLLLHGWGDDGMTFRQLIGVLKTGHDVLVLDLPGFGGTKAPEGIWGLTEYAIFVRQFLKKLEVHKVEAIIGHSNGGAIALRGLGTGVLHAEKLVLLASSGVRDTYRGRNKVLRLAARTGKVLTKPLPESARDKLRRKAYETVGSDLFVADHLQETFKKVVTDDTQTDAKKLKLPTLIIYGSDDTSTPPLFGERYQAAIKGSKLELVEAGHFVHHDQAQQVNSLIQEFLK